MTYVSRHFISHVPCSGIRLLVLIFRRLFALRPKRITSSHTISLDSHKQMKERDDTCYHYHNQLFQHDADDTVWPLCMGSSHISNCVLPKLK